MVQDDAHLVYAPRTTVADTLDALLRLGVGTVRVTVQWSLIAPVPAASSPPPHFDASDPGDYPARAWAPYDRVVELARARGIAVDFDVTAPGPLWAMARGAPAPNLAEQWYPSAAQFGEFVAALGTRYSGQYVAEGTATRLPRVSYWSIWNEPNQPRSLAPQWRDVDGAELMEAPVLYRAYVDVAFGALERTGHGPATDTILVGELAPEGCEVRSPCVYPRYDWALAPIPFLRALYCVDARDRPLTGAAAIEDGCAAGGDPSAFVASNPGLFEETGFSEHPYSFSLRPDVQVRDRNFVPLADLPRLERALDEIFGAYGVARRLPLYLTQYGYETNPPNPFRGVSLRLQAAYLDEAEYMAWRDPRVRVLSQLLLYDSPPDTHYRRGTVGYWSTFQTGLLFENGGVKPSARAYALPVFVPHPVLGAGRRVLIWAMLRAAPATGIARGLIQWRSRPSESFTTVASAIASDPNHVIAQRVSLPGPGEVRIAWAAPSGERFYSLAVGVRGG